MSHCIGIDVSKHTLDIHFADGGIDRKIGHDEEGIRAFVQEVLPMEPELIVMEATGGYEEDLAEALFAAGLPVAVVNPKRIRDFAKAIGRTAKTDKIDARTIASFGATLRPPKRGAFDETARELKALTVRRGQLVDMRTAESNRAEHARNSALESVRAVVAFLEERIAEVEEEIRKLIRSSSALKEKIEIMESFPGIGEKTAAALAAHLPELGTLDRKRVAALTGTAPINRDSGRFRGRRTTFGGRRKIRKMLYMPTLSALRWNPTIKAFYNRLLSKGKIKKVAVVACMRKIFAILNSMVRNKRAWNADFA